jgi:hypothetical protein
MTYSGQSQTAFVAVKRQQSQQRGEVWRVCVFVDGKRLIRPGFQKRKPAVKLAAMLVQQMLIHGWRVNWEVRDENDKLIDINLADLGGKMKRGEDRGKK